MPDDAPASRPWPRLAAGVLAIGAGAAAFVWPSATVRVAGLLFGLDLVVIGTIRAVLLLVVPGYPEWYRIVGACCGVLTAVAGVLCLRHVAVSVVLLSVTLLLGGMLRSLPESFPTGGDPADGAGARPVGGATLIGTVVTVLILARLEPAALVALGGVVLLGTGAARVAGAVANLRSASRAGM
ncbi:hypothetical protein Ani05nite_06790 [Amorphoplanes nipponensis]|uniref:Uncharacterized protein n=1 Tax=Actinoplanes nipponensis TaxID=135950 RepID=A0A919JD31_9ACTN|nr:DUF308 domain-containing protein [Actinoplanes nipponensis]GIE47145.1 hypothetical protein Ani05nite_06790 [Actinoplanes nipponensis]